MLVDERKVAAKECLREIMVGGEGEIEPLKKKFSKKFGFQQMLKNSELIGAAQDDATKRMLRKSAVRSASGVSVVAIMVAPVSCPYNCAYCPTSSIAAKSYTGYEPAARRARQNDFDAGRQVAARIRQFVANGHAPDKCELIVMGGTFNVQPTEYQTSFLKSAFDAFNGEESPTLQEALEKNEGAAHRVVGVTFETRPDCAGKQQVSQLVDFGATRVELGVQSLDEEALRKSRRGHGVDATIAATKNCKDALLKVGYHFMPGLFSSQSKDEEMMKTIFAKQEFRPDMLKIYPTLVMPGTELFEMWEKGEFAPYGTEEAARVIASCKRSVPEYCRVMRVDRDIPADRIAAGVKKTNLRELVKKEMEENGWECRCIRCREVGLKRKEVGSVELKETRYDASGGREVFISLETKGDLLAGYLRLRMPSEPFRKEISVKTAGIRELRVLGEQVAIGKRVAGAAQHKNFGGQLLEKAHEIAAEWGCEKLTAISGVGVKEYYCRKGFARDGAYVSKSV